MSIPLRSWPTSLKGMIPRRVPQLHVGSDEAIVDVDVGRFELQDSEGVGRTVRGAQGRFSRVGEEVG